MSAWVAGQGRRRREHEGERGAKGHSERGGPGIDVKGLSLHSRRSGFGLTRWMLCCLPLLGGLRQHDDRADAVRRAARA